MKHQNTPVVALLVHNQDTPLAQLRVELASLEVETYRARSCQYAKSFLERAIQHPQVLFTDVVLSDGTWVDMLAIARDIRPLVNVIVVSSQLDPQIYLDALERGASDFMVPPFEAPKLEHVLRCATVKPKPVALGERMRGASDATRSIPKQYCRPIRSWRCDEGCDEGGSWFGG